MLFWYNLSIVGKSAAFVGGLIVADGAIQYRVSSDWFYPALVTLNQ